MSEIRFVDVSKRYDKGPEVIRGLELQAPGDGGQKEAVELSAHEADSRLNGGLGIGRPGDRREPHGALLASLPGQPAASQAFSQARAIDLISRPLR